MNKTIYIRDEDGPLWEKARQFSGDKMSVLIMERLREFVEQKEAEQAAKTSGTAEGLL